MERICKKYMGKLSKKVFICFSAKDRYTVAQPVVYHLKNLGIDVWYDRYEMTMGNNRYKKNIKKGAGKCGYALIILSQNTASSLCASEEIEILKCRYMRKNVTIFPVLYELKPNDIPSQFCWVKELIFKEINRYSGTLEICNHIGCKITEDMLINCKYKSVKEIIDDGLNVIPNYVKQLLKKYIEIDNANLNSRITMLYATYIIIIEFSDTTQLSTCVMPKKIFDKLFSETKLSLAMDYRELWLLENALCLLINHCYIS